MWQIIPSSMLPLASGIKSRLLSVNHALISPTLIHPVVLLQLVPSSHHLNILSLFHSRLSPSHHSLTFLLAPQIRLCWPSCAFINYIYLLTYFRTDSMDLPWWYILTTATITLSIPLSISIFAFSFFYFLVVSPCTTLSWLTTAFECMLK